jgi:RNA polymerase sigma-70 factor (ECF subfamily)
MCVETVRQATTLPTSSRCSDAGDLAAIFSRNFEPVYRFLYRRVGNREDAEDLASEIFLKAARELDTCRSEASIQRWLFTVARTVLADHWRRYYHFGPIAALEDLQVSSPDPIESPTSKPETKRDVAAILQALPERYRRVLQLRFLNGLSVAETAQELGVTPGNARVLQHRALERAVALGVPLPAESSDPDGPLTDLLDRAGA